MIQVQVQFIDKVAIVLMKQTVQVVEKDSRSCTSAVCGQGRCWDCCVAKGDAHDPESQEVHRGVPTEIKWTRCLTFLTYDKWDARCVSGTGAEHPDDCQISQAQFMPPRGDSANHRKDREECCDVPVSGS